MASVYTVTVLAIVILYLGTCTLRPPWSLPDLRQCCLDSLSVPLCWKGSARLQMASLFTLQNFSLLHRLHPKKPGGHFCSRATSTQAATTLQFGGLWISGWLDTEHCCRGEHRRKGNYYAGWEALTFCEGLEEGGSLTGLRASCKPNF